MNPMMLPVTVAVVCIGVTLMVYARFVSRHGQWKPITAPTRLNQMISNTQGRIGAMNQRALLLAVAATVAYWLLTRWMLALVIVPVLIIMVPKLLLPKDTGVQKLDEIVAWLGILAGRIKGGAHLESAIKSSYTAAGENLKVPLRRLIARLNASWPTGKSLDAFAQDLNDPTIDRVIFLLKIAARERGDGLSTALANITQQTRNEIEVRRKVNATQGSARQTVLMLNIIIFSAVLLMAPQTPIYRTAAGQIVFLALFAALIGVMVIIRRSVAPRPVPRILGDVVSTRPASSPSPHRAKNPSQKTPAAATVGGDGR